LLLFVSLQKVAESSANHVRTQVKEGLL